MLFFIIKVLVYYLVLKYSDILILKDYLFS